MIKVPTDLFVHLQNEAQLANNALLNGLSEIADADFSDYKKGKFYSGTFQLGIALERIFKLIIILNHMKNNKLTPPTSKEIRKDGHDIATLYKKVKEISGKNKINNVFLREDNYELDIILTLSKIAETARYYNLDKLKNADTSSQSPFKDWDRENPLHAITQTIEVIYVNLCPDHIRQKRENEIFKNLDEKTLSSYIISPLTGGYSMYIDVMTIINRTYYGKGYFNSQIIKILKHTIPVMSLLVEECHEIETNQFNNIQIVPYIADFFL